MPSKPTLLQNIVRNIKESGLTLYDNLAQRPDLYLSSEGLEELLKNALVGMSLDYPLRTRSKVVKTAVCRALGYPVPDRFLRVRPRFPGQNFDTYVQKANNLQIWNEDVSRDRRYVIIGLDNASRIKAVRVVTGDVIAVLDTTGTLTQKYQAAARKPVASNILVTDTDTSHVLNLIKKECKPSQAGKYFPSDRFIPIKRLYNELCKLVGQRIKDPGSDQERNRGAVLHALVQRALGYGAHIDTGQFPDEPHQLLEIKLQTSPTIDLGLVSPDSVEPVALIPQVRHCDVRYAVFYATALKNEVRIDCVVVCTGESFFSFFRKFKGKEINRKLQIRLPDDFFA
jgi:hypothetical protein